MINAINKALDQTLTFNLAQQIERETVLLCQEQTSKHGAAMVLSFSLLWSYLQDEHSLSLDTLSSLASASPQPSSLGSGLGGNCSPVSSCSSPGLFQFPSKFSTARGSKTLWGNTHSSHPQSGPSSPKLEPLKSFPLLLGLFAHVLYSFIDTNKPSRNNFN